LNDYEGISGHEEYRPDLVLMYFPSFDSATGKLAALEMTPLRIHRFRLQRAASDEAEWLANRMNRECTRFGGEVRLRDDQRLELHW
jgi:poly-gamma-glutamate synthesis protein (capsule biosynthesis protein)